MAVEWRADRTEDPGVRTGRVLALVGGFLAFTIVLFGLLDLYYRTVLASRPVTVELQHFPAPRLQPNPNEDYLNFHAAQEQELAPGAARTGSANAPSTAAAMPIDKAMAIVVARGPQAYDPPAGTSPAGPDLANGAAQDGAPRATPSPDVAPYGQTR